MGNKNSAHSAQDPENFLEEEEAAQVAAATPQASAPRAAKLFCFDTENNKWLPQSMSVVPEIGKQDDNDEPDGQVLELPGFLEVLVSDELRLTVDQSARTWHFFADGTWCLKFYTQEAFAETTNRFDNALFANQFKMEPTAENKQKVFNGESYSGCFTQDDEFWDAPETEEERAPPTAMKERRKEDGAASAAHQLQMGGLANSFLVREGCVEVFRNDADGVTPTEMTISLQHGANRLTPHKALLQDHERNMLLLTPDPKQRHSIFQMDLEHETVVSEWKFVKDGVEVPMADIATSSKSSQMESCHTFMGLDKNRICRWDTRTAQGMVDATTPVALEYSAGHDFSKKMCFECMATTGDGGTAVGSRDGSIRLYSDRSLSRAKTAFPGLGAPITAIDVSFDGKWVLATTDSYLIVVNTVFRNQKSGETTTGFKASMGSQMSAPRLLQLLPVDLQRSRNARLHSAHFTWITEQGSQERWIVASCGNFSVLWNFRVVKSLHNSGLSTQGLRVCTEYTLSAEKDEAVVESAFMHDRYNSNVNQMVVATEHDLYSCSGMELD